MNIIIVNLISLLSLVGFLVAFYIYSKKRNKKKLICPIRSNCDKVVHSKYSEIAGVPLEILGIAYYFFINISYNIVLIFKLNNFYVSLVLTAVSLCSVLFSVYLLSIQVFILKQWCAWCISSSVISALIFIVSCVNLILF